MAFVDGPPSFASFDDLLARTIEFNPTRTESSLRRGILHNAMQLEDGSWVWRYARFRLGTDAGDTRPLHEFGALWDVVSTIEVPLMLVRGMREQSVVDDADEAELLRRCPGARIEHVADAGHSVQGDTPVELAQLIDSFAHGLIAAPSDPHARGRDPSVVQVVRVPLPPCGRGWVRCEHSRWAPRGRCRNG